MGKVARLFLGPDFGIPGLAGITAPALGGSFAFFGPEDLNREFIHPESGSTRLAESIGAYSWHGRHHLTDIEETVRREGWK